MSSVFSRIVKGEIPCHKIAENDKYLAFLDISPLAEGHTLVIPKEEVDHIIDLDPELAAGLMVFAQKVGKALHTVFGKSRIGMMVAGFEVPHVHIHVVPINSEEELSFDRPRLGVTGQHLALLAEDIRKAYEAL